MIGAVVVVAMVSLISEVCAEGAATMGPFDVIVTDILPCENMDTPGEVWIDHLQTRKEGNGYFFDLIFHTKAPIGDDVALRLHFSVREKTGYKPNVLVQDAEHFCQDMDKFYPELQAALLKGYNSTQCPFPPGDSQLENLPMGYFKPKVIERFMYGKFKVDAVFLRGGESIGCVSYFADTIPLKTKRKGR